MSVRVGVLMGVCAVHACVNVNLIVKTNESVQKTPAGGPIRLFRDRSAAEAC